MGEATRRVSSDFQAQVKPLLLTDLNTTSATSYPSVSVLMQSYSNRCLIASFIADSQDTMWE
jgi:hypothetical protein